MFRHITTGVLAALIVASAAVANAQAVREPQTVNHGPRIANQQPDVPAWWRQQCRFQNLDGHGGYTTDEVIRTIRCATWRWYRGHLPTVRCIAERESGYYQYADNPYSSASGVFQIIDDTWDGWRFSVPPDGHATRAAEFRLSTSVWDARANVMIAVWQMGDSGTGPWGYACST